jgi:hypothetical protein
MAFEEGVANKDGRTQMTIVADIVEERAIKAISIGAFKDFEPQQISDFLHDIRVKPVMRGDDGKVVNTNMASPLEQVRRDSGRATTAPKWTLTLPKGVMSDFDEYMETSPLPPRQILLGIVEEWWEENKTQIKQQVKKEREIANETKKEQSNKNSRLLNRFS